MHPLLASILFHAIGAASAACCYVPQKKVKRWSWQSYWLIQASFCWLLLPIIGAFLTVPNFSFVVHGAPTSAMRNAFLLGAAYGIGGTAFGIAIRYVGFSITYAMAIGVSTVMGTAYAIAKGDTTILESAAHFQAFIAKTGSFWVTSGIGIGVIGIIFCGLAGRWKERDHNQAGNGNALIGLLLCLLAGVLSAVYGMALSEGAPVANMANLVSRFDVSQPDALKAAAPNLSISELANLVAPADLSKPEDRDKLAKKGIDVEKLASLKKETQVMGISAETFSNNAIYPFSNAGAFLTTALYCLYLHRRHKTLGEAVALPEGEEKASLPINWSMAILTGCLWYGQFFFYGFGHFYIEKVKGFEQTCWAIHMILLILLGTLIGVVFKEWKNCKTRTYAALTFALLLLIGGKLMLDYGNYQGEQASKAAQTQPVANVQ